MSRKVKRLGDWFADQWIALIAIAISISSLSVSLYECENARLHDQPRLVYVYFYDRTGAGWRFENEGLGPARIRGFKISINGKPQTSLPEVWRTLSIPDGTEVEFNIPRVGNLIAAGATSKLFWVPLGPAADIIQRKWDKVVIVACYCSIHDQCWQFSSDEKPDPNGDPRNDSCSAFAKSQRGPWWNG
jgi:hypothetical protein